MKLMVKVALVVFAGTLMQCAMLYYQARSGKKLPWKLNLTPTLDIGGDE